MSCLIALLRYRLLHEYRYALRGTACRRLKSLLLVLAPLFGLFVVAAYYAILVQSSAPLLSAGDGSRRRVLEASLIVGGAIAFLIMFMEMLQQLWFARDGEALAIAPVSNAIGVAYRSLFAVLHGAPWIVLFLSFPLLVVFAFPRTRMATDFLILILLIAYWIWLASCAACAASLVAAAANRWRLGRHGLYVALYLFQIMIFIYVFVSLEARWPTLAGRLDLPAWSALLPPHQLAAIAIGTRHAGLLGSMSAVVSLTASLGCPPLLCYFAAVRLWHWASRPAAATKRENRIVCPRSHSLPFSNNRSWAIFQKDLRDLLRNPMYRNSLVATFFLLATGLWAQARKPAAAPLLAATLALIYTVPLFISGRAASQEYGLLEFYKLVLPSSFSPLDAKLRCQTVVNWALTLAAALPFFLLLRPGFQMFTVLYFAGAAFLSVPVFTALALALGTYFPVISNVPSALGIRLKGFVIYTLLGAIFYSLLLNRLYLGAGICLVFLAAASTVFYRCARRRLYALIEGRFL